MANAALKARNENLPMDSDIGASDRKALARELSATLANTYVLYHKTQGVHWNVTGGLFYSVHKLTEEHYADMAEAIDELAERIRTLGEPAPTTLAGYVDKSIIDEAGDIPEVGDMLNMLAADHRKVADHMRGVVETAEQASDVYTADLLTARIGAHEEAAWMLSALAAK